MRDLENRIQDWRKQMLVNGIKSPVPLDELENHLREEIELQIKLGLAEADAFAAAVRKIGGGRPLREEFEKVAQARRSRQQELRQLVAIVTLVMLGFYAGVFALFRIGTCAEMTPTEQRSSLLAVVLMVVFGLAGQWGRVGFPIIHSQRTRKMIGIMAVLLVALWGSIFFFVILQRSDFNMGELITAFYWAFLVPMGFVPGLMMGIENSARKSVAAEAS